MNRPVYLDHNATTPVAPEVLEAMLPCLREAFGNPSSSYGLGREAAELIAEARSAIAALIRAQEEEIVFTGCATEANNLALIGVARSVGEARRHLVVSAVEHPAVMEPARYLERQGWALTVVPVDVHGRIDPEDVAAALRPDTALVSVMLANNEVGTLQPITEIAATARSRGILMHTDAAQAVGKIPVDVDELQVDLLTMAGHKFGATKGVGALYVREGTPIRRILFGAGHERGLRPGTENVPAIVGMGAAARRAAEHFAGADDHLRQCRDRMHQILQRAIPDLLLNGHPEQRLPNTLNVSFPGANGQTLLNAARDDVSASVGSACHADDARPSGVLGAMGLDTVRAAGAVRLSTGRETGEADVVRAAEALIKAWRGTS